MTTSPRHSSAHRASWRESGEWTNVLSLTSEEVALVEHDLEHRAALQIGSRAEIAVLSALTKRHDAIDTEGCLTIFDLIDSDRNGVITLEELEVGMRAAVVREYVEKTRNVTLKALLRNDRKKMEAVIKTIDTCDSGVITRADWTKFVRAMALERARYMKVVGLLQGRCYWGLGLSSSSTSDRTVDNDPEDLRDDTTTQCVCLPPQGYCADLQFYFRNNHPYFALFFRDEAHPFGKRDAFVAELVKQCFCLFASIYVDRKEHSWSTVSGALHNWKLAILYVSLPLMILGELLFYALACPCLRFEKRGRKRESCLKCIETSGVCLGHFLVWPLGIIALLLLALALRAFYLAPDKHADFALTWIAGLLSEYAFTWPLLTLSVHFNRCYPDCRNCPCYGCFGACCGLWHYFSCGRWSTERRHAAEIALNEDDDEFFETFLTL